MHAPAIIHRHFILSYVHPTTYGLRLTLFTSSSSSNRGLFHENRSTTSECISFASLVLILLPHGCAFTRVIPSFAFTHLTLIHPHTASTSSTALREEIRVTFGYEIS